jgi:hypothetical protein
MGVSERPSVSAVDERTTECTDKSGECDLAMPAAPWTRPMQPLERKAAFKAAATMARVSAATAARQLGVSYNHLMLVLNGERTGSERLCGAIAAFLGCTDVDVFGNRARRVAPEPRSSTQR